MVFAEVEPAFSVILSAFVKVKWCWLVILFSVLVVTDLGKWNVPLEIIFQVKVLNDDATRLEAEGEVEPDISKAERSVFVNYLSFDFLSEIRV